MSGRLSQRDALFEVVRDGHPSMKAASFIFLCIAALTGFAIERAHAGACLVRTTQNNPYGNAGITVISSCAPSSEHCDDSPPSGYCALPWPSNIISKDCRIIPHC